MVVDEQLRARLVADGRSEPGLQVCGLLLERGDESVEHCQGPAGAGRLPAGRAQIGHESVSVLPERRIVAGLAGIGLEAGERAAHLREPVGLLGPQLFAALLSGPEQIVLAFALQESFGQGVLSGVELALQLPVLDAVHGLVLQPGGLPASCTAEPPANSRYVPAAPCRGTPGRCPTTRRGPRADQWQPRCHR